MQLSIWKKLFFTYGLLLISISLTSQIKEYKKVNIVDVFSEEDLIKLDKIDSVDHLVISILKKTTKIYSIKLKHPELLKSLSIHHPESYVFLDSLSNLNLIGIEGKFYGTLKVKFNPLKIDTLVVYNFRNTNYSFFEQFKNLRSIDVGFYYKSDKLFESLSKFNSLKFLSFYSHRGPVKLPLYVGDISSLHHIEGNIKFNSENLRLLTGMKNVKEVTFTFINVKNVPKEYFELNEKKKVVFTNCKGDSPLKTRNIAN